MIAIKQRLSSSGLDSLNPNFKCYISRSEVPEQGLARCDIFYSFMTVQQICIMYANITVVAMSLATSKNVMLTDAYTAGGFGVSINHER